MLCNLSWNFAQRPAAHTNRQGKAGGKSKSGGGKGKGQGFGPKSAGGGWAPYTNTFRPVDKGKGKGKAKSDFPSGPSHFSATDMDIDDEDCDTSDDISEMIRLVREEVTKTQHLAKVMGQHLP